MAHQIQNPNNSDYLDKFVDLEPTRFRIRIYEPDPKTGLPGRDLCPDIIEVRNTNDQDITVDLHDKNIVIPGKKFYVAIEWLRIYSNAMYAMQRSEQDLIYTPSPGMLPYKTDRLHIYGLTYIHQWKPYSYFSPYWTDLAISATVKW